MRWPMWRFLAAACFLGTALAQSATPTSTANSTSRANGTNVITTTITSLIPITSGSDTRTSTSLLTLTLTLNTTGPSNLQNTTLANGTIIAANGTILDNGTVPWNDTMGFVPFHIRIDPAYGTLGGLLLISGIPVAILGGKNRWSSLAIVSGYAFMLFTLVMILRFGVEPNLQPPSPNPPSTTLRGLYLLAGIIAAFIGAGLGLFLYKFAKYFVATAGGFTFAWYLLATKSGGLISSVLGRWGLLGGLTVGTLVLSIVPKMVEPMMLVSTAWIGATAFVLGIDCFTRAGLKEFYVYNLGFHSLFPKLNGGKYPLTQTMMIELGIIAAIVVIGSAIQARVLNRLQKHMRQIREEEEMRIEAQEVEKAAERFKNVGSELEAWEEKHGHGSTTAKGDGGGLSPTLPVLNHDDRPVHERGQSTNSTTVLLSSRDAPGSSSIDYIGPAPATSYINRFGTEELHDTQDSAGQFGNLFSSTPSSSPTTAIPGDADLESKLKLLEDVRKARESIRGSIDELRRTTPTPTLGGHLDAHSRPVTPAASLFGRSERDLLGRDVQSRQSTAPLLGEAPSFRDRKISSGSSEILDDPRYRTYSSTSSRLLDNNGRMSLGPESLSRPLSEWDRYAAERTILAPPIAVSPVQSTFSQYSEGAARPNTYVDSTGRAGKTASMIDFPSVVARRSVQFPDQGMQSSGMSRPASVMDAQAMGPPQPMGPPQWPAQYHSLPSAQHHGMDRSSSMMNTHVNESGQIEYRITGSAAGGHAMSAQGSSNRRSMQRTMTYDELAEKHRKRISALQHPVTAQMKEAESVRLERERWEKQKRLEKLQMEKRQREGVIPERDYDKERERVKAKQEDRQEVLKTTDEWRRSVNAGLDGFAVRPPPAAARPAEGGDSGRRMSRRQSHMSIVN